MSAPVFILCGLLMTLVIVRQLLTLHENQSLVRQIAEFNRDLEQMVLITSTSLKDFAAAEQAAKSVERAKAEGLGVIFISHTLPHVLQVTDRVVVLRLGRVVKDAPTSEFDVDTLLGTITGLISD